MSLPFRVLELYSGIGGMHCALEESGISYEVVLAMDINTTANQIYRHNFRDTKISSSTIQMLTEEQLRGLKIDMVLMSPPCQPFTRMGKKRDADDLRTSSFLHFMHLLTRLEFPPHYLLVENVRGFESSHTRQILLDTLQQCGYIWQEFLLTPLQFGIPNSRLRYYLLAKLPPNDFIFQRKTEIIKDIPAQASPFLRYRDSCHAQSKSDKNREMYSSGSEDSGHLLTEEESNRKLDFHLERLHCSESITDCTKENELTASKHHDALATIFDTHECDLCLETSKQGLPLATSASCDIVSSMIDNVSLETLNITNGSHRHSGGCNHVTTDCTVRTSNDKLSPAYLVELELCSHSLRLTHEDDLANYPECLALDEFLEHCDEGGGYFDEYMLADRDLLRFVIMDVVHASLRKCSCFTKRYGHFMEGAGSIIMKTDSIEDISMSVSLKERAIELKNSNTWAQPELVILRKLRLRYFTPREIANLLCFPLSFNLLKGLSTIQHYRVLGNSLNVHVVSVLINLLTMNPECSTIT